ncbi:MAG: tetratricopeptide repeat protein [Myxococcales bacterium]|nr:tetratricopeptide repeat protein [Myxococcales bacterium]
MRRTLTVTALAAWLSGCATTIDVRRHQPAIVELHSASPGIGFLQVHADDEVMARAPNDFSNMTGLVLKAAKGYFQAENASFAVVDYTDLGYQPKWVRSRTPNEPLQYRLDSLPGVPAGAQTPLVTAVKVLDWRTYVETVDKTSRDVARVSLLFSTWAKDGQPVRTEAITAEAFAKVNGVRLTNHPGSGRLVVWYQKSSTYSSAWLPEDRVALMRQAIEHAVALHLYPLLPHQVSERLVLADDDPYKEGVLLAQSGRYDEALASWLKVAQSNPKAHGALYNAALMHLVRGEDAKAEELLLKAVSIDDRWLYGELLRSVRDRLAMKKQVGLPAVTRN